MDIDRVTWSVWAFGLSLLLYWRPQTLRELRALFAKRKGRKTGAPAE